MKNTKRQAATRISAESHGGRGGCESKRATSPNESRMGGATVGHLSRKLFTKEVNERVRPNKLKDPEIDSLGAFLRVGENGLLRCCGYDQSGFCRLFFGPPNLGPTLLLSSGNLGATLIAHATFSCLLYWHPCYLGCLSCGCLRLWSNSFAFQAQGTRLLQGVDAALDFSQ